jgi:hypothetical protein
MSDLIFALVGLLALVGAGFAIVRLLRHSQDDPRRV